MQTLKIKPPEPRFCKDGASEYRVIFSEKYVVTPNFLFGFQYPLPRSAFPAKL